MIQVICDITQRCFCGDNISSINATNVNRMCWNFIEGPEKILEFEPVFMCYFRCVYIRDALNCQFVIIRMCYYFKNYEWVIATNQIWKSILECTLIAAIV